MSIPIQNVYYLLTYAWDKLAEAELVDIHADDATSLPDLFARVLESGVNHLMRRGLDHNYISTIERIPGIRGRIRISESIKQCTFAKGHAVCEFDELSADVLHNRLIKSTLRSLAQCEQVDKQVRHRLHSMCQSLPAIRAIRIQDQMFRQVRLHRNNAFYRFLLDVCEIVHSNLLVHDRTGGSRFRDFVRDPKHMAALFEKFVLNFYKKELTNYETKADRFSWQGTTGSSESMSRLPEMRLDVGLRRPDHFIVLDTKFYAEAMQSHHGNLRVNTGNIYQLFAYMKNLELRLDPDIQVDGVLLYPAVREHFSLQYEMHGHEVLVQSIDLTQDWRCIHDDLLSLPGLFQAAPQPLHTASGHP